MPSFFDIARVEATALGRVIGKQASRALSGSNSGFQRFNAGMMGSIADSLKGIGKMSDRGLAGLGGMEVGSTLGGIYGMLDDDTSVIGGAMKGAVFGGALGLGGYMGRNAYLAGRAAYGEGWQAAGKAGWKSFQTQAIDSASLLRNKLTNAPNAFYSTMKNILS